MPMMLLTAAIAFAQPQAHAPSSVAQATATIRVIAAVRLKLDALDNAGAPRARDTRVKVVGGSEQPAKLIEFQ